MEFCGNMTKKSVTARMSNREIHFWGERRDEILTPLLLIKNYVQRAIIHFLSHDTARVSSRHLYWLQSEFENLVTSAYQEVAALSEGSTATPFDNWNYSQEGVGFLRSGVHSRALVLGKDSQDIAEGRIPKKRAP